MIDPFDDDAVHRWLLEQQAATDALMQPVVAAMRAKQPELFDFTADLAALSDEADDDDLDDLDNDERQLRAEEREDNAFLAALLAEDANDG